MIQRYSRAEMREIWSEQRKLEIWLQIELLASEALVREGLVPKKDFAQMKSRAAFKLERCKELERVLNHDVVAFTTNVSENIGAPASRWLHFGLTSSDVLDTAFAVQMAQSADILIADVKELRKVIAAKARKYKFTPMIGRSHGIHAEPTTFGLKLALMYDEFGRALQWLEAAKKAVAVGKLSGAVGTSAHLSPQVEAFVCQKLGLRPAPIAIAGNSARFARRIHRRPRAGRRQHRALGHGISSLATHGSFGGRGIFCRGPKGFQRHAAQAQSNHR